MSLLKPDSNALPIIAGSPKVARLSIFERAGASLSRKTRAPLQQSHPAGTSRQTLLEKYQSLQGAEKITFFRANREALIPADAESSTSSSVNPAALVKPSLTNAMPAHGDKPRTAPTHGEAETLLEKFNKLQGSARTAFFRDKKSLLKAAAAAVEFFPAANASKQPPASAEPAQATAPVVGAKTETPEALLAEFQAMSGPGKTAFFRANQSLLKAAGAVVEARESARVTMAALAEREASAMRNFSVTQAQALPRVSGASLLAKFNLLTGSAKNAFFRANHAALKIAASSLTTSN